MDSVRGPNESTDTRSVTDLLRELRDETTLLVRQEVALAKTEMSEKASRVGRNAGYLVAGGLVAYAGLIFILLAATAAIGLVMESAGLEGSSMWLAPLVTGGIVAVIGGVLVSKSLNTLSSESPVPEKTIQTLKEDKQWVQNKVT